MLNASHSPIQILGWGQSNARFWEHPSVLRSRGSHQPAAGARGLPPTYSTLKKKKSTKLTMKNPVLSILL